MGVKSQRNSKNMWSWNNMYLTICIFNALNASYVCPVSASMSFYNQKYMSRR